MPRMRIMCIGFRHRESDRKIHMEIHCLNVGPFSLRLLIEESSSNAYICQQILP